MMIEPSLETFEFLRSEVDYDMPYPDQDAFNIVFKGRIVQLPPRCVAARSLVEGLEGARLTIFDGSSIAGVLKRTVLFFPGSLEQGSTPPRALSIVSLCLSSPPPLPST
jgi:hypothetical protein